MSFSYFILLIKSIFSVSKALTIIEISLIVSILYIWGVVTTAIYILKYGAISEKRVHY